MSNFNGVVEFKKNALGYWIVCAVTEVPFYKFYLRAEKRFGELRVQGDFKFKPKCGFSIKPHKLIDWSVN